MSPSGTRTRLGNCVNIADEKRAYVLSDRGTFLARLDDFEDRGAVWEQPLAEPCPSCGWPVVTLKVTKRRGAEKVCPKCKHAAAADQAEAAAQQEAG